MIRLKVAVAYCKNYELFEYCKNQRIKLDYFGRLDDSINLDLEKLKSFLTDDISIHIIGGSKFHSKVIWCNGYGAYIGSANLTQSAWENNIECGLWVTQKELEDDGLTNSLNDFFKFIQKEAKLLKDISGQDISKLNKLKEQTQNSLSNSEASLIIKEKIGIFDGCSKRNTERNFPSDQQSLDDGTYKKGSNWNDCNEMRCFLVFRELEEKGFPRGMQSELCRKMADIPNIGLSEKTIKFQS